MDAIIIIAVIFLAFDAQNVVAVTRRWLVQAGDGASEDYTIIVPVYGHRRYFDQRAHLAPYRERVLVALDLGGDGTAELADELEAEGWTVHRTRLAMPGPPGLVLDALESGRVRTKYAFRMDADTHPVDDLGAYVAAMEREGVDFASVRVHVRGPRRAVERIQALEYRMAMRGRRLRPWLSSGACYGGTSESVARTLRLHSMWFPGEDLEAGRVALALGLRVRHLDLRVETDAPASWRALLRQRRSWWSGGFRHAVINADKNARHTPIWTFYNLGLVVIGAGFKISGHVPVHSISSLAVGFAVLFGIYTVITFVANWPVRSWWMFAYPPYALAQALALPIAGSVYWARDARRQRHWGRYRFGYRRGDRLRVLNYPVGAPRRPAHVVRPALPSGGRRPAGAAVAAAAMVAFIALAAWTPSRVADTWRELPAAEPERSAVVVQSSNEEPSPPVELSASAAVELSASAPVASTSDVPTDPVQAVATPEPPDAPIALLPPEEPEELPTVTTTGPPPIGVVAAPTPPAEPSPPVEATPPSSPPGDPKAAAPSPEDEPGQGEEPVAPDPGADTAPVEAGEAQPLPGS